MIFRIISVFSVFLLGVLISIYLGPSRRGIRKSLEVENYRLETLFYQLKNIPENENLLELFSLNVKKDFLVQKTNLYFSNEITL